MKAPSDSITKEIIHDTRFSYREICKENKCLAFKTYKAEICGNKLSLTDSCDGSIYVGGCFAEKERRAYFKKCGLEYLLEHFRN